MIRWNILPDAAVTASAINHQVPGPRLQLTEGDHVRINFINHLPEPATMHLARPRRAQRDGRSRRHHPGARTTRRAVRLTYPAMLMEGGLPNYFTINGKAWPATVEP